MSIRIGTSGWSYGHWEGVLYPRGTPSRDRLFHYLPHFRRYHSEDTEDYKEFTRVLKTLEAHMPLRKTPRFEDHLEECYVKSLGCIGVLKDWMSRALAAACEDNQESVSYSLLMKHAYPPDVCKQIAHEIYRGERRIAEAEDESLFDDARSYLKGVDPHAGDPESQAERGGHDSDSETSGGAAEQRSKPRSTRTTPVGKRKPGRDKVGMQRTAA